MSTQERVVASNGLDYGRNKHGRCSYISRDYGDTVTSQVKVKTEHLRSK